MRIHVVGVGAVGSFVAFHLRRTLSPKHSVVALHRKQHAPTFSQRPHGESVLLDVDGVTHAQDGVEHIHYTVWQNRFEELAIPTSLKPALQRRADYRPRLFRPDDPHELPQVHSAFDSLIVATKAYAVSNVLQSLRTFITRDTTIVLMNNGMGVYEQLVGRLFQDPHDRPNFVLCTNTHGLWRKDPMHVVQTGIGEMQLGIAPDPVGHDYEAVLANARQPTFAELSLDDIANVDEGTTIHPRNLNLRNTIQALTAARALGASWRPYKDVQTAMKRKLVVNAFVNPLSALLQCQNGRVLDSDHGHWILERLCEEAETLLRAELEMNRSVQLRAHKELLESRYNATDPQPPPPPRIPFPGVLTKAALQEEVRRVVQQTGHNWSSMCQDVRLGQPTEIEFINGHLRRMAMRFRIPALVNETLYQMINMRTSIPYIAQPS